VEIVPCILALREGVIAPTIGYQEHDPECALDVVPNEARDAKVNVAISNAFAFGGLNAVLVLQKI
jgi:nodulation protein E